MKRPAGEQSVVVDLTAVIVSVAGDQPRVLVRPQGSGGGLESLPSGPLELRHRTLEAGLRAWVTAQTGTTLGYVEQLYTFGDEDRTPDHGDGNRVLSIGYLALTRAGTGTAPGETVWHDWYRHFPWEDWRRGRPAVLQRLEQALQRWTAGGKSKPERALRQERASVAFGLDGAAWSDERVLDRYELLYEIGVVAEARRKGGVTAEAKLDGLPMAADHRRILATAIARLRGKIKYRPVVFELMPPTFTFLQLQRAVETLAGVRLHKQNFRRLVTQQGLVEETGEMVAGTGGRPARELRYRQEAILERPAPGVRLPAVRGTE